MIVNGLLDTVSKKSSPTMAPQTYISVPQSSVPKAFPSAPKASTPSPMASVPKASTSAQQVSKSQLEESLTHGLKNHGVIHQWTANQEDMLVNIRHERATDFLKNKNHAVLWKEIVTRLNDEIGCNINTQQALNKYNNLKKRWKEIIDSKSGSETKYFRQRDAFDEAYGTRASTKPSLVIDSGSKVKLMYAEDTQDAGNNQTHKVTDVANIKEKTSKKKTPIKRKSTELVELIKEQESDFKDRMEQYHRDKMSRMDRLLDLYEREINAKTKHTGNPSVKD